MQHIIAKLKKSPHILILGLIAALSFTLNFYAISNNVSEMNITRHASKA